MYWFILKTRQLSRKTNIVQIIIITRRYIYIDGSIYPPPSLLYLTCIEALFILYTPTTKVHAEPLICIHSNPPLYYITIEY